MFAYALDRIRAPWRLTAAEWRMHAKLFAQNLAVIAVMVAIAYGIVALIFGRLAGMKAAGVVAFLPTPAAATRSRIQPMMALLGHATARAGRGRV